VTRAVLDANVIVGAFPSNHGPLAGVLAAWRNQQFTLVSSEQILAEVERAWQSRYWRQRVSPDVVKHSLELLRISAEVVPITAPVSGVASHPEDDLILATAASGAADYLVTGDRQLLALGTFYEVRIVSARQFLDTVTV
jgi:uncharacterized protein